MKKPALTAVVFSLLALAFAPLALASAVAHSETLKVGNTTLRVHFSEFPLRAERSFDLTIEAAGGIAGKSASFQLIRPDGTPRDGAENQPLPRFPRDRSLWGLDSVALPQTGTWQLAITIDQNTATLPFTLLERPAGPSNLLILWLAALPMLALLVLVLRAWLRVRPLRQAEATAWH
jgi:hypothetical protein